MLVPLKFTPGLVRDLTMYANQQGWYECDKIRFWLGFPQKMGGWVKEVDSQFLGVCRELINWTTLDATFYIGLGTNLKYYLLYGGTYYDVTPIRKTTDPMAADPFTTVDGSTTVTVTDVANGAVLNDFVTFSGAVGFNGLTADDLNKEFQITSIIDADNYTIDVGVSAVGSGAGGGAVVVAEYQINVGLDTAVPGLGWGAGPWGSGTWGTSASSSTYINLRLWNADTFGEDLITNVSDGGIYYWDATTPFDRMIPLGSLAGASNAPTVATDVMVSAEERHVIAFACNPTGSAVQDNLLIRWSDTENAANWTTAVTNSAGEYRLSVGTFIVGAVKTRSEILVWTDNALYSMRWTGAPYTFSFTLLGVGTSITSPNSAVSINDNAYWMSHNQFFFYDGRIQPLDCPVADYVFTRLNLTQAEKIFGFTNSHYDEVGWLYPAGEECDSYVIYNYKEKCWYFGSLDRTCWLDRGPSYYPLATSTDRYLFDHEVGYDDGSTNPPSPITAYIQSSPIESPADGQGEHFQFVSRIIPDVTFRNSSASSPSVIMTVKMQDYPGQDFSQTYPSTITKTASVPIEQFTKQAFIRLRGRSAVYRIESTGLGVAWRLGVPRIEIRPDGLR